MKASEVIFSENEIVIIGAQSPKTVRFALTVLLILFLIAPIVIASLNVTLGDGLNIGLVPISLVLWAAAYFFMKSILWNTYGRETITLNPESIAYTADYKYFKTSRTITPDDLEFTHIEMEEDTKTFIIADLTGELIENVLPVSKHHMRKLENHIKEYYFRVT
ncbi:hypothetical protein [Kordia sp.]|uniref:hypothetical protein n=1 Tax=Kordia sp. TaxID=1965332 RepID=UPI003B5BCEE2